jgi:hypothetical protein
MPWGGGGRRGCAEERKGRGAASCATHPASASGVASVFAGLRPLRPACSSSNFACMALATAAGIEPPSSTSMAAVSAAAAGAAAAAAAEGCCCCCCVRWKRASSRSATSLAITPTPPHARATHAAAAAAAAVVSQSASGSHPPAEPRRRQATRRGTGGVLTARRVVLVQRLDQLLAHSVQVSLELVRLQHERVPLVLEERQHPGDAGRARGARASDLRRCATTGGGRYGGEQWGCNRSGVRGAGGRARTVTTRDAAWVRNRGGNPSLRGGEMGAGLEGRSDLALPPRRP